MSNWSDTIFIEAMQKGDTRNRQILPPMYARYYRNLSGTDLKAI